MPGSSAPLRLFVALYPPPAVASSLLESLAGMDLPPHRLTAPEQAHLTLHFLGDVDGRRAEEIAESVERSAGGIAPFTLEALRLVALPRSAPGDRRQPPRLVAAQTSAPPGLLELQRRLAQRMARFVRPKAGDRFLPHITLARLADGPGAWDVAGLEAPLPPTAWEVASIRLVRSVLRAEGARHDVVSETGLAG